MLCARKNGSSPRELIFRLEQVL